MADDIFAKMELESQRRIELRIALCNHQAAAADIELELSVDTRDSERLTRRKARRALEAGLQHAVPPGPWDDDLDMYPPGQEYKIDLGDGYEGILERHPERWFWIGRIRLPAGHCCIGKKCTFLYNKMEGKWRFPINVGSPPEPTDVFSLYDGMGFEDVEPFHTFTDTMRDYERRDDDYLRQCGTYRTYDMKLANIRKVKTHFKKLEKHKRVDVQIGYLKWLADLNASNVCCIHYDSYRQKLYEAREAGSTVSEEEMNAADAKTNATCEETKRRIETALRAAADPAAAAALYDTFLAELEEHRRRIKDERS